VHIRLVPRAVTTRSFEGVVAEAAWLERPKQHFRYRKASDLHELDQKCVKKQYCLSYWTLDSGLLPIRGDRRLRVR
jgi:hypothetical protein